MELLITKSSDNTRDVCPQRNFWENLFSLGFDNYLDKSLVLSTYPCKLYGWISLVASIIL